MPTFAITAAQNIDALTRVGTKAAQTWNRATTTATVNTTAHGMATNDVIYVTVASDAFAITLGAKTITFISANQFSFTCANSGATSGTISYTATDNFNINGGTLTIDQDSRGGLNGSDSTTLGALTISASLGGTVEIDGRYIRLIPYNTGSGVVPTYGTTVSESGGGGSGKLIGVYSALTATATAAGASMPASGYLKVKQWNGSPFDAGAMTGITCNSLGGDVYGTLSIVGNEAALATVPRLGLFRARGEWYELGTTTGTRSDTYQLPTYGELMYCAGVWVETYPGGNDHEFYPNAGSLTALPANIATDAVRGRWCWITTAGVVRFGHDGTNSTGGYCPASGCSIRVHNLFFQNCTVANKAVNALPNATLASRYSFVTTGAGQISLSKINLNWYPVFAQAFEVLMDNVAIMTALNVSECASPINWSFIGVGQEAANTQTALTMATCFAGVTMGSCVWTRATLASSGNYVVSLTDVSDLAIDSQRIHALGGARGNATTGAMTLTRVNDGVWDTPTIGGGRVLLSTCKGIEFNSASYYDHPATTTPVTNPQSAFEAVLSCSDVQVDGLDFGGLVMCQPYSGILSVGASGCSDIRLRNIGSYASPLDMGDAQQNGVSWSRTSTTATVTKTAHGLKVNDIIYVLISDSVAAITVGSKTVASVPTADTFTFTALNAGGTSGVLTYYPTMTALLFALASGAASSSVKVQRCYTPHLRTNLFTTDNSSKGLIMDNVMGDYINAPVSPDLQSTIRGLFSTHAMTGQTSCYGTHWFDCFITGVTPNISAQSWARTTTTATVTSNGHNLRTGMLINVTTTSDAAAIVKGQKTITVTGVNTFTFTCLNAGGTSGTLTFQAFNGRIGVLMNERNADTTGQQTIDSGTPAFTSAGGLYAPTINQQVTFTMPSFLLGHDTFPIAEAVMAGGTIANYDLTYALDTGAGFSSFKNLYYPRAGGGGTNGSTNVTMTDTTGVAAGDYVWGTNIAPNAKVNSITNGTTVVVDLPNIGTVSGVLRFNQLPSESALPSTGAKMKIRVKTTTTNATAITSIYAFTTSTETTRAYQYVLDTASLTITGVLAGSDVVILDAGTTTVLDTGDAIAGTSHTWQYDPGAYSLVDIRVYKPGYVMVPFKNVAIDAAGASIPVSQLVDRSYI